MQTHVTEVGSDFDPRAKLVAVMCLSSLAVVFQRPLPLALILILAVLSARYFRSDAVQAARRLRAFLWIFAAMAFVQSLFTAGGAPLLSVCGISLLSTLGLERAGSIVLRFLVIIVSASIMATSSPREIVQGLYQWRVPYELAFMVAVAVRFLPLLRDEAHDALTAIQLRGLKLESIPLRQRLQIYSYLLMPMIASVLGKARELAVAVEMRGFRAYDRRTSHRTLRMRARDWGVVSAAVLVSVGVLGVFMHM